MARNGNEDCGDDDIVELQLWVGGDKAEQVLTGVSPAVGGQRQELGDQSRERRGAGVDFVRAGQRAEHSDNRRRLRAQHFGVVRI